MKIFFYFGTNPENKSRMSLKMWKIERKGRKVTAWWGAAVMKNRRPVALYLQSKSWSLRTESQAVEFERRRIKEKLGKGYERSPRRRTCD